MSNDMSNFDIINGMDIANYNYDNLSQEQKPTGFDDSRIWKPDTKVAGTYEIRFLPSVLSKVSQKYITIKRHFTKYFVDGEKKTLFGVCCYNAKKQSCPLCLKAKNLYDTKIKADAKEAKNYSGTVSHYANVLIVRDPIKPENNGKVFLYEFKKQIMQVLESREFPTDIQKQDTDFVAYNPFDLFRGGNFKLKVEMTTNDNGEEICTYKSSDFSNNTKPVGTENEIKLLLSKCYILDDIKAEFTTDDKILTSEKIKETVGYLLGNGNQRNQGSSSQREDNSRNETYYNNDVNSELGIGTDNGGGSYEDTSSGNDLTEDEEAFFK